MLTPSTEIKLLSIDCICAQGLPQVSQQKDPQKDCCVLRQGCWFFLPVHFLQDLLHVHNVAHLIQEPFVNGCEFVNDIHRDFIIQGLPKIGQHQTAPLIHALQIQI